VSPGSGVKVLRRLRELRLNADGGASSLAITAVTLTHPDGRSMISTHQFGSESALYSVPEGLSNTNVLLDLLG
jgi:hypothetical protein